MLKEKGSINFESLALKELREEKERAKLKEEFLEKRGEQKKEGYGEIKKEINYGEINLLSPKDFEILKSISEKEFEEFSKKNGLKQRSMRDFFNKVESTLIELESLQESSFNLSDRELEELAQKIDNGEDLEGYREINQNKDIFNLLVDSYFSIALSLPLKEVREKISNNEIRRGDIIRKSKIRRSKRMKKTMEVLRWSKLYSLILLLENSDGFEGEEVLSVLLPSLLQSSLGEKEIKKIVSSLLSSLKKGKIRGSWEFFYKLRKISSLLSIFGGGKISSIISSLFK